MEQINIKVQCPRDITTRTVYAFLVDSSFYVCNGCDFLCGLDVCNSCVSEITSYLNKHGHSNLDSAPFASRFKL